ncbi:MAG: hypothetical protein MMC33_009499 [Icmadophila ericetorum]|nr:hypothetical protein [Icmadophila ericetorum]
MATLDQWTNLRKEMANVRSMNVNRLATSEIPAGGPTEEETIAKGAKIEEHRSTESEKEDSEVFFVVWEAGRKKFFAINGTKI